ncbi:MAG: secretin N-terminal domain-containing protein [Phycisphaerae bacterium]|nr:secretin N-terminal domain-containing protein [Phycisphaerae bacterium]
MWYSWLILIAALGQTTPPESFGPVAKRTIISGGRVTVIPVGAVADSPTATRPAAGSLRTVGTISTASRPAASARPRGVERSVPSTRPARAVSSTVVTKPTTRPSDETVAATPKPLPLRGAPATRPESSVDLNAVRRKLQASSAAPGVAARSPAAPAPSAVEIQELGPLSGDTIGIHSTATGELIIEANEEDLKVIEALINLLDAQPPEAEQTVKVFTLQSAQATDVATNIQKLWNEYKKPVSGQVRPEDRLTIIPDPRANLLMVATAIANLEQVEMMVEALDQSPIGGNVKVVPLPLKHIKAAEAQEAIKNLLKLLQQQRGASKELYTLYADVRTNMLLVSASERDIEQIRQLLEIIDVEPSPETGGVAKVALVPLKKAVATDLVKALNEMLVSQTDAAKAMQEQIRRLQVVLAKDGKELDPVNLEKPIKLWAEPGTNSVIIATVESNIEPLVAIINELDDMPLGDDIMLSMFPLEHADVVSLRDDLQKIFDQSQKVTDVPGKEAVKGRTPDTITKGLMAPISLVADRRTNTLIVSGRPEQLLLVQQIVKQVDVDKIANKFPVRMIKLEHSDVRRIRELAQQLADERKKMAEKYGENYAERESVLLIEDVRTNSLIVAANDSNFQEIEDLVKKLDGIEDDWLGQIKIINLPENLTAPDIASKVEELWQRRAKLRQEGGLPADEPVIVSDSRTNSLVIASNMEDFEAIQKLVDQLGQQKLSPMLDIYQVRVKNNDAGKVAETVQDVMDKRLENSRDPDTKEQPSERVYVVADPLTRMLLVVASKSNYDEVVSLVNKLDTPPPVDGIIRVYYVRNIDVAKAEKTITDLFEKGIYKPGVNEADLPESMKKVTIIPDVRSSCLIVSASPENYAIVEKVLEEIDRSETPMAQAYARFFDLQHADAVKSAETLTTMLDGLKQSMPSDQADELGFSITPEVRNNRLIVVGTRYAMQRVEEIVPKLDIAPRIPSGVTQYYELKKASAGQLAKSLTDLFEKQAPKGEQTPITIIPEEGSNGLIVTASQDDHIKMQELIGLLDRDTRYSQQMEIIPLAEAKAEEVAETLTDLMEPQQQDREGGFTVAPESRTNSLAVWATPDLMTQIKNIVAKIDLAGPTDARSMRVFKLQTAKAEDLGKLLDDFFKNAGASSGDGQNTRKMIIDFVAHRNPETGEEITQKLVHQDVTIVPDPYTNSLLVLAPAGSIDMMRMLVEMLDSIEPQTISLRVFELLNADAEEMRDLLEGLFQTQGGGGGDSAPQITLGEGAAASLAAAAGVGGTGGVLEVEFSVDKRTNTLIAAGSPAHLRIVESLVLQLDYKELDERIAKVVQLRNTRASEVAKTLTEYFDQETELMEKAFGEEASQRRFQRQVIVTEAATGPVAADESGSGSNKKESNLLLVSCSPRMESLVYRMINELDQPIPQVMIQMLMAEVTVDDSFDLGMEFAAQDLLFSETATINANTGLPQGPDYDVVFGTDLGVATGGGFSFTVTGEDFSFLLRALQGEGRTEILARPSIMVQDGQAAYISIGDQVPIVKSASVSEGVVIPTVDYVDATVKLTVTPIINPDNFVNMYIKPEIKNVSASSQDLGNGIKAPIINTREAETSVTIKDGETIIIGGLIKGKRDDTESKVPIVGDIPILGNLFRSTTKRDTKTELLIILTPRVMRAVEDSRKLSIEMRDQTGIIDDRIRSNPLMQGLQVKPADVEGVQIPVTTQPADQESEEDELFGPEIDEYGPAASSIRTSPVPAVVVEPAVKVSAKTER